MASKNGENAKCKRSRRFLQIIAARVSYRRGIEPQHEGVKEDLAGAFDGRHSSSHTGGLRLLAQLGLSRHSLLLVWLVWLSSTLLLCR